MTSLLDKANRLHTLPTLRGHSCVYSPTLGGPLTLGGYPPNVRRLTQNKIRSLNLYELFVLNEYKYIDKTGLFLSRANETF